MKDRPNHQHRWHYPGGLIDGKRPGESRVVRHCDCGAKQMAIVPAKAWRPAKGDYALPEHYLD